ncbi:MAG: hypothetical protein J0L62_14385 [Bacteroidetes bacterium]|nr:hypothetical protein [Bacteroidota bacterium]
MSTLKIDILNPKATRLLQDLADLKLISITDTSGDQFLKIIKKLRRNEGKVLPTMEEITNEVEVVRTARYEKAK